MSNERHTSFRLDRRHDASAGPADGAEVNAVMRCEPLFHRFTEITLANEAAQAMRQKGGQERIHPATGGRAGGANHLAGPRGRRADEVEQLSDEVHRQLRLLTDHLE